MTTALKLYRAAHFPDLMMGQSLKTRHQPALPMGKSFGDDAHTTLEYQGKGEFPEFDRFLVTHEELIEFTGRYGSESFRQVIHETRFDLYRHRNSDLAVAKGGTKPIKSAMRRLRSEGKCVVDEMEFDLLKLRADLKKLGAVISGAHFRALKMVNIAAASVYGEGVDRSEEFKNYELAGLNSAIIITTDVRGLDEKFMFTREGVAVPYANRDAKDLLEFALGVAEITRSAEVRLTAPPAS